VVHLCYGPPRSSAETDSPVTCLITEVGDEQVRLLGLDDEIRQCGL